MKYEIYQQLKTFYETSPTKIKENVLKILQNDIQAENIKNNNDIFHYSMDYLKICFQNDDNKAMINTTLISLIQNLKAVPSEPSVSFCQIVQDIIESFNKQKKKTAKIELFSLMQDEDESGDEQLMKTDETGDKMKED